MHLMTTQDEPVEAGSTPAPQSDQLDGIVEQTRGDVDLEHVTPGEVREVLRQRLEDAGISADDSTFDELVERVLAR